MKTIELNTLGFIQEIKEHKEFKSFMLNYILNNNFNSHINVSITDWTDAKNPDREYVIEISKFLKTYLANVSRKLKALDIQVSNIWFQRYFKHSEHEWHYHPKSNWTAVYYVELPEEKVKTQLYDLSKDKIIDDIKLKEGDLFIFPANILHRSPPNISEEPKTIVSFNINFDKCEWDTQSNSVESRL